MLPQMSDLERALLKDLAFRIERGDYDDDRRPDEPRWVPVARWIVRHAFALIAWCWLAGISIAVGRIILGWY